MKHGGDISLARMQFGATREDWLDLSTGIAPWPYPLPRLAPEVWQRLPQANDLEHLLAVARRCYGVADAATVIAAPGTQILIQLLPFMVAGPTRVRILGPTYSEHAASWRCTVPDTREVCALDELADADVIVITNPNNPDGRRLAPEDILALTSGAGAGNRLIIVDEAFADVLPEVSLAAHAGSDSIIILRSFGKFFGLAGLRLGFAIGSAGNMRVLERLLGPWAVSGPACTAGTTALGDTRWIATARRQYADHARRLDALLAARGLTVIGGTSLFRLASHQSAPNIHSELAQNGILTRRFDDHPTWLRFGLPGSDAAFARLDAALVRSTNHPSSRRCC